MTNRVSRECDDNLKRYLRLGYISKVPEVKRSLAEWFLPHFPVMGEDKVTTKVRIVFDASAKCQGKSLNDAILPGPKLQHDIFDVLLRFRKFQIAPVGDISKMFLQVGMCGEDRRYH